MLTNFTFQNYLSLLHEPWSICGHFQFINIVYDGITMVTNVSRPLNENYGV